MSQPSSRNGLESRIARLETAVPQIRDDLHGLRAELTAYMVEMRQAVKTPTTTIMRGVGLGLAALVAVGGLVAFGLDAKSADLQHRHEAHVRLEAHPQSLRQWGRVEAQIEFLREAVSELRRR